MLRLNVMAAGAALAGFLCSVAPSAAQDEATCDVGRPVMFAGLDYGSAAFHTALAQQILRLGYGCEVDAIPGATLPLAQAVGRGDVDVIMEIWTANPAQAWVDAEQAGTVVQLGTTFPDAVEAWWVPAYVVEGEGAVAPDLKAVADLPAHKALFTDPEEPSKGRFYNCIAGWNCEVVNTKKLAAYRLDGDFTNFRPGTGAALEAAVTSAILREKPIVFYYWTPTWLMGKYSFYRLEEPPYDKAVWDAMMASDQPTAATAYPVSTVVIGANKAFAEGAPVVAGFLRNYAMTSALTSEALAYMQDNDASAEAAATWFLKQHPEIWTGWVPQSVAGRVESAI